MDIRITIEVADDFTRRGIKWKELSQREYEFNPQYLERSLALALRHAEEEFGLSSEEATALRHLIVDLTK